MAIKIDLDLLQQLGLAGLPEAEKNSLLRHIYETLEMRVGVRLADQMTNEQLDEFEKYFDAKDDAGAFKWLETNFPNYKDIVQQEFEKLKLEIGQSASQIVAASQQAQVPTGQTPQNVTPPQSTAPQPPEALSPYQQPPMQQQPMPGYEPPAAPAPAQPYAVPPQPSQPPADPASGQPQSPPQPWQPPISPQ